MTTEYRVAPVWTPAPDATALDDLIENTRAVPAEVGFLVRKDDQWDPVTYQEFLARVTGLTRGLIAAGIALGDRVALMSRNRIEWALCDYAIWMVGAVTVPMYDTSSAEQVEWMLSDSGAVAVVVEGEQHGEVIASLRPRLPALTRVWSIDAGDLDRLTEFGDGVADSVVAERRAAMTSSTLATVVYTSGTTGRPKGCRITHRNLMSVVGNTTGAPGIAGIFNADSSTLLFLPLAHCLARVIHLACVRARVQVGYTPDIKQLPTDLATFRPTVILAVPRVFEKLYNAARHAASAGRISSTVFDQADRVAVAWSEASDVGRPAPALRAKHAIFDRLVYRRIRAGLGGRVAWSVSGGAPLGARLGHFFRGIGVNVLEGYGLSETTTGGTLNLPGRQRVGSVGAPIPGCTVRIDDHGEILILGAAVFDGYWHNESATAETIDAEGWLHTGDIGHLDNGFLTITGRIKELIVTAGGKNVAPSVLEDRVQAHALVSHCVVIGDRRPFISCLVTLDAEIFADWNRAHGKANTESAHVLRADPQLLEAVQGAVDDANSAVSTAESIRKFTILDADLSEAAGSLTPTLKVKRDAVAREFHLEIEALYA